MIHDLLIITVLGRDREGLVADITGGLAGRGINIIDIEQSVIHRLFSMFMLVDISQSTSGDEEIRELLFDIGSRLDVKIDVMTYTAYVGDRKKKKGDMRRITLLAGKDSPGIVAGISKSLFDLGANIERIKMIARGELFVMEMCIDTKGEISDRALRDSLRDWGDTRGIDIIIQPEAASKVRKKLVVFDMDGTIVDAEIIDELAKAAGLGRKVSELTARGMAGEMDFEQGLRERVKMLKGTPVNVLENIRDNVKLTPGSEELIVSLKGMGYKVALISGGFTYFTDALKERLGFDYTFANELGIKDGRVTGEIKGEVIDAKRKAEILDDLARKEKLSRDEVVAIGDGANDQIMLQNAGLGIAFNAKDVLKKVADGNLTKNNLKGLLYCLGVEERT